MSDPFLEARTHGRVARRALDADQRSAATAAAVSDLVSLDELRSPTGLGRIALSRAISHELDVSAAAPILRTASWSVWLPVVSDIDTSMHFREWRAGDVWGLGAFDIEEPPQDGRPNLCAADLDVVVAPCVAIDARGTRVGFGAGYYDRALAGPAPGPLLIVAAFDVQVVDEPLPTRSWDVPAAIVVTDRRTIRTGR